MRKSVQNEEGFTLKGTTGTIEKELDEKGKEKVKFNAKDAIVKEAGKKYKRVTIEKNIEDVNKDEQILDDDAPLI